MLADLVVVLGVCVKTDNSVGSLAQARIGSIESQVCASFIWGERNTEMQKMTDAFPKIYSLVVGGLLVLCLFALGNTPSFSQGRPKAETIQAVTTGTGTQAGQITTMMLIIYEFSTDEDKQILVDAFNKSQNQGLFNALSKMKAIGRISLTGTLGMDVSYIRMFPTPTGRKIRFVTNRTIAYGEAYYDNSPQSFNLTGGELDLNDSDRKQSKGVLYPAAKLVIDKEGQLQIQLNQNVWQLVDIIDKKGTPGKN